MSRSRSPMKSKRERKSNNAEKNNNRKMSKEDLNELAELVAQNIKRIEREENERKREQERLSEFWDEGKDFLTCRCCALYSKAEDVPHQMVKSAKKDYGIVSRMSKSGVQRTKWDLKFITDRHMKIDLHIWCARKAKLEINTKASFDEENEEVAVLVIRSALKNLKRGLGAADFMSDIDFLTSTEKLPNSQKNNSRSAFFEIRDDAFEIVSEDIKTFFTSGKASEISCTLDKVTLNHISYMVLLTFFFHEGKIYVLLNKLITLDSNSYNSSGTAALVATQLRETLGLSRTRLGGVLVHFAYDGVFASAEERVDGGGCLELVAMVEDELGLERGSLTGTWDHAHQLQVMQSLKPIRVPKMVVYNCLLCS